jgi:U3 small nucleolar RNA-associated protein 20
MVDPGVSDKQQAGFLTLLGDVLRNLGPRLVDYWPALLGTAIDLVASAQTRVRMGKILGRIWMDPRYANLG